MMFRILVSISFFSFALKADAQTLSLDQYREQVRAAHQGLQASELKARGASARAKDEDDLFYQPSALAEIKRTDDQRPTLSSSFQGTQTVTNKYSLGVKKTTRFGLQSQLTYDLINTEIVGASSALVPQSTFYDGAIAVELTQPLWQNGFGRLNKVQSEATEANANRALYSERYNIDLILRDAETKYWRLAVARELVKISRESVQRAKDIVNWQSRRVRERLVDAADLLQAQAALKMRELELDAALAELVLAERAFNDHRSNASEAVPEAVSIPSFKDLGKWQIPLAHRDRFDVVANRYANESARASMEASRERLLPELNLVGSGSYNAKESNFGDSASKPWGARNPYYAIGLKLIFPLDRGATNSVRDGYAQEAAGTELAYRRSLIDQENDWRVIAQQFETAKKRLALAIELESAQERKLEAERIRHRQGRSTTYQISLFEQDFLNAQLTRVRAASEILSLRAQMRIYQDEKQ